MLNVIYFSFAWFNRPVATLEAEPFVQQGLELKVLGERDASSKEEALATRRSSYCLAIGPWDRSEEHTSELQSRFDLVCRLLLEKKKDKKPSTTGLTSENE